MSPAEDYSDILIAVQVPRFPGAEEKTVRNWMSDGMIPFTKLGGATRHRISELSAASDAGENGNATKWKRPPQAASKGTKKTEKATFFSIVDSTVAASYFACAIHQGTVSKS